MGSFDDRMKFYTTILSVLMTLYVVSIITDLIERETLQGISIILIFLLLSLISDNIQELRRFMAQQIQTDYVISDSIEVRNLHIRHIGDQYEAGGLRISMDADLSIEDSQGFPVAVITGEELVMLIKYYQQIDMDEVFARNAKIKAEE